MPDYRRARAPGATWFFTVNLLERHGNALLVREIDRLRACLQAERQRRSFVILAWVVLPEHMHWLWRLPPGDTHYSTRWRRIKTDFSRGLPRSERRSQIRQARGERGIWQRRFWEHQIRDERDLQHHIDYIHFNPVNMASWRAPRIGPIRASPLMSREADTRWTGPRHVRSVCQATDSHGIQEPRNP